MLRFRGCPLSAISRRRAAITSHHPDLAGTSGYRGGATTKMTDFRIVFEISYRNLEAWVAKRLGLKSVNIPDSKALLEAWANFLDECPLGRATIERFVTASMDDISWGQPKLIVTAVGNGKEFQEACSYIEQLTDRDKSN
jgi:hypothetical protein